MLWLILAGSVAGGLVLSAILACWAVPRLWKRGPYAGFMGLPIRAKLSFFRLLLTDRRVPLYVKLLVLGVIVYLVSPIDLMPGIPMDDLAVAFLALVLIAKLTPRQVVQDLVEQAQSATSQTIAENPPPPARGDGAVD